jgi:hypothetical protein
VLSDGVRGYSGDRGSEESGRLFFGAADPVLPTKRQPSLLGLPKIAALPFHFGYNAGGSITAQVPGGYSEHGGGYVTQDNHENLAMAMERGYFMHFHTFAYHENYDDAYLNLLIRGEDVYCGQCPNVDSNDGTRYLSFAFTPTKFMSHLDDIRVLCWNNPKVLKQCDRLQDLFAATGSETWDYAPTHPMIYVGPSGWWGDPDGYYYMEEIRYRNPSVDPEGPPYTSAETRLYDLYGICLIRELYGDDLSYVSDIHLYSDGEEDLPTFVPFSCFHGYYSGYTFYFASDEYPDSYVAPMGFEITVNLEDDEKFEDFKKRLTVTMTISATGAGVLDATMVWEWWLPEEVPFLVTVRRWNVATSQPVFFDITESGGSWTWSGSMVRSLHSGKWFLPSVIFGISLPHNPFKRFNWTDQI